MTTNATGTTPRLLTLFLDYESARNAWMDADTDGRVLDAAELRWRTTRERLVEALTDADAEDLAAVPVPVLSLVKHRQERPDRPNGDRDAVLRAVGLVDGERHQVTWSDDQEW